MKNKALIIISVLAFILLIAGVYFLYSYLSDNYALDPLTMSGSQSDKETETEDQIEQTTDTQSAEPEETEVESTFEESSSEENTSEESNSEELQRVPDFTVTDADGNEVALYDFIGKPIVLNFWASWCGPCKSEMPDFDETYAEYKDEIQFLMINLTDGSKETKEKAMDFISDKGYSFPVYYDTESDAAITYGVYAIPTTFFIDKDGYAVAYAQSALDKETLLRGISMITEQ